MKSILSLALLSLIVHPVIVHAQKHGTDQHSPGVDTRGEHAMGFSLDTTKHHFTLLSDGGIIAVEANEEKDVATQDQIRSHLTHISSLFAANDFNIPMFIHDTVPPGVPVMKEKHAEIAYTYERTTKGGQVRVTSHSPEALKAIHEFLLFQIQEHRTGDTTTVKPS